MFDMDGLLVDTERMFRDVMMEASRRRGVDLPLEVFLRMVGLQRDASRAVALAHFGDDFDYEPWIADAWALAFARIEVGVAIKDGALELLDFLEEAGIPRAVATSSSHSTVERQLGPRRSWRPATMSAASRRPTPFCWPPRGWGLRRRSVWRSRTRTMASAPPTPRA